MRMRLLPWAAGLFVVLAALPVRAADPKPDKPAILVRIKSLDGLVADSRYLADIAGKGEEAKQLEGTLKSLLDGVDMKKPLGLYGYIATDVAKSTAVVLLPISDEKKFLGTLENFNQKAEKGDDGVYSVDVPGSPMGPVYFRFANGYAYATVGDKGNLAKGKLLDPSVIAPPSPSTMVAASIDIGKIPDQLKQFAVGQSANGLAGLKEQKEPNETDAQHLLRVATLDEAADLVKMLTNESGEVTLSVDLDRTKGDLSMSLSLAGQPGSKLAKKLADLGGAKSVGAGLVGPDSAMNILLHLSLPDRIRKALDPVIDETVKKALADEKDKDKRALGEQAFKALGPTLKSGEFDFGVNFRGPSAANKYAMVMALKVKDGAALEKTFRDLIAKAPEKDRKNVTMDFAKAGKVSIHKVEGSELDAQSKEMFGEGPAFFAVRDDAVMIAVGDGGLQALKDALAGQAKLSKTLQFEMSLSRMAPLMAKQQPGAVEAAKKAFAQHKDADRLTISLEGGKALTLKFNMKAQLVQFFALLAEGQKKID